MRRKEIGLCRLALHSTRFSSIVENILSIVLLLPPAPAALVLVGRALAALSALSAAAFRRIAVFGPPGGVGEEGRPVLVPMECCVATGELDLGED